MKTMVIRSESPQEDRQAAFTIMQECKKGSRVAKIVWYSDIAKLVALLEKRLDKADATLRQREIEFTKATEACLKAIDRVRNVEIDSMNYKAAINEIETWMKAKIQSEKKEQKSKEKKNKLEEPKDEEA